MSGTRKINFLVYKTEPLMWLIKRITWMTPIKLGLIFFLIALSLHIVAAIYRYISPLELKRSFLLNTSWSIAIVYLYPFIIGLTLKYYLEIPKLYNHIIKNIFKIENADSEESKEIYEKLNCAYNNWLICPLSILATIVLNYVYVIQTLNSHPVDWMNKGEIWKDILHTDSGLSVPGFCAIIIQIILVYWVINLLVRGCIFAWSMHYLFNKKHIQIKLDPMHHDSCCGLKRIGEVSMILNVMLFLFGIYISLKVVDKAVIQSKSLLSDIGNPVMLITFTILAPVLFFFPLGAAHSIMKRTKDEFLEKVTAKIKIITKKLEDVSGDKERFECIQTINETVKYLDSMKKNIFVWPFNFKSLEAFFVTILVPLLPILIPLILYLFKIKLPKI